MHNQSTPFLFDDIKMIIKTCDKLFKNDAKITKLKNKLILQKRATITTTTIQKKSKFQKSSISIDKVNKKEEREKIIKGIKNVRKIFC